MADTILQSDQDSADPKDRTDKTAQPAAGRIWAVPSQMLMLTPPPVLVLLAVLSLQLGAAIAVNLFPVLGPNGTVFWRVALSAMLLMAIARPTLHGLNRRGLWLLLMYGTSIAVMNLCFYQAIARIPLGIAVAIEFLGPLGVAAATSRKLSHFLWVLLAGGGIALLSPEIGVNLDPWGVAFAGIAAVAWGGFVLLSVRVGKTFPGTQGLAWGMLIAALLIAPFGIETITAFTIDPLLIFAVIGVALLSTTIPFRLEFEALKRMPPRIYGILITTEPAVAAVIGALLLGQSLGTTGMIAIACVMAAALGASVTKDK
ncbi:MAG: EamA family transporter [Pseudomonadota bacterium]